MSLKTLIAFGMMCICDDLLTVAIFSGDAHCTDATPLNIFNKKLTMTTVTRQ